MYKVNCFKEFLSGSEKLINIKEVNGRILFFKTTTLTNILVVLSTIVTRPAGTQQHRVWVGGAWADGAWVDGPTHYVVNPNC